MIVSTAAAYSCIVAHLHYMPRLKRKVPPEEKYTMHSNACSHIFWAFKLYKALHYVKVMQYCCCLFCRPAIYHATKWFCSFITMAMI